MLDGGGEGGKSGKTKNKEGGQGEGENAGEGREDEENKGKWENVGEEAVDEGKKRKKRELKGDNAYQKERVGIEYSKRENITTKRKTK